MRGDRQVRLAAPIQCRCWRRATSLPRESLAGHVSGSPRDDPQSVCLRLVAARPILEHRLRPLDLRRRSVVIDKHMRRKYGHSVVVGADLQSYFLDDQSFRAGVMISTPDRLAPALANVVVTGRACRRRIVRPRVTAVTVGEGVLGRVRPRALLLVQQVLDLFWSPVPPAARGRQRRPAQYPHAARRNPVALQASASTDSHLNEHTSCR